MATKSLKLNLTVDYSSNRVLFAEADKDLVDVLLSFLTLPLGTLVSIADKNSLPCLDNLYKSVQGLRDEYFQSPPCRDMLLKPNHAAEFDCLDLFLNVEGDRALKYYACSQKHCVHELLSSYANAWCACGRKMSRKVEVVRACARNEGVFLKGVIRFTITDDFTVTVSSTRDALLHCASISSSTVVEREVNVGLPEVIAILCQSLIFDAALTNVFLARGNDVSLNKKNRDFVLVSRPKPSPDPSQEKVDVKLVVDKHENKVIYAECKHEFVDMLFSFLTYPSGFVVKSLSGKSDLTCFDNLYASVLDQKIVDCFKTSESKENIINPKLPSQYRLSKSLIKSDKAMPNRYYMCRNPGCPSDEISLIPNVVCKCMHITNKRMKIVDPRSSTNISTDRGFVSEGTYIVTDDLVVTPLHSLSILARMIANARDGVEEITVEIGEKEALALLEAGLGSQSVLTDVLLVKE